MSAPQQLRREDLTDEQWAAACELFSLAAQFKVVAAQRRRSQQQQDSPPN